MFVKITIAILLSLVCCSCDKDTMILELKDVQNFQCTEKQQATALQISGLAFHSALAIEKMTSKRRDQDLIIELHLVRARRDLSGSFDFNIPVPTGVTRVLFGKERREIWKKT